MQKSSKDLKKQIIIKFNDEQGVDYGWLTREWAIKAYWK
jgi:hypothetical protein